MNRPVRQHSFAGLAGCVRQRKARQTGTLVGVYHGEQSGLECTPDEPWVSVCEEHGSIVSHPTQDLAIAHAADPQGWCEDCRKPASEENHGQ